MIKLTYRTEIAKWGCRGPRGSGGDANIPGRWSALTLFTQYMPIRKLGITVH